MSYFPQRPDGLSTADKLRQVMADNGLTNANVSEICCVSVKTVESWLATPGSASYRSMSPRHMHLLKFTLPTFIARRKAAQKRVK